MPDAPQVSEQARAAAAALQEDHTDPAALFPDNYFAGSDLDASEIFEAAPVFEPDVNTW